MGLLDWVQRLFGRKPTEQADENDDAPGTITPAEALAKAPSADVAAPLPPPSGKKSKKKSRKKKTRPSLPKPEQTPKIRANAETETPKPKKKKRKKRKQPKGDPRLMKSVPTAEPSATSVKTPSPTPPPAQKPAPSEPPPQTPKPAPTPPSKPAPILPPEPEPVIAPEPVAASAEPQPRRPRGDSTLAWVVLPKFEALLASVDGTLATEDASRETLTSARARFRREWRALSPVPSAHADRLNAEYSTRLSTLAARVAAIPDPRAEEEARSLTEREALIARAQALAKIEDVREAVNQARALQEAWRSTGRVPRETVEDVNTRWKTAIDAVYTRRAAERTERIRKLTGVVEQAELLVKNTDPFKSADAMKRLQARWKMIGGVGGEEGDALWTRFRAAADQIFERRRASIAEREQTNLEAKQALIAHVQELATQGVEDPEEVSREMHRRWKRIGHIPREQSDAVWTQFKEACARLHEAPPIDPALLGDGEQSLKFSPFSVLNDD